MKYWSFTNNIFRYLQSSYRTTSIENFVISYIICRSHYIPLAIRLLGHPFANSRLSWQLLTIGALLTIYFLVLTVFPTYYKHWKLHHQLHDLPQPYIGLICLLGHPFANFSVPYFFSCVCNPRVIFLGHLLSFF